MDAVIAYVNPMEESWRVQYDTIVGGPAVNPMRFEDYGTLKYVLRGIDSCMPFIDRVFLIVSSIEQIPEYIDKTKIKIIAHEEFIPKEFLPTFNSCTIEMFLWNISSLSERFIYFNDDMIPIREMSEIEFFNFGKPCIKFRKNESMKGRQIVEILNNCNIMASALFNKFPISTLTPLHTATPYLKSIYRQAYFSFEDEIKNRITKVRSNKNISQYFFSNYLFYSENYFNYAPGFQYVFPADGEKELVSYINDSTNKIICVNGIENAELRNALIPTLNNFLKNKCKYEL